MLRAFIVQCFTWKGCLIASSKKRHFNELKGTQKILEASWKHPLTRPKALLIHEPCNMNQSYQTSL